MAGHATNGKAIRMAVVRTEPIEEVAPLIRYVFGKQRSGDPSDGEKCAPEAEDAIANFRAVREMHDFKGKHQGLAIYQSWGPEESKKLNREEVNKMGRELVENIFPGHQFLVVTHSNTPKLHNHIIVNIVNMETGKLIRNKYEHLHKLRARNDEICLARGLSIPNQAATERKDRMPNRVKAMERWRGPSWTLDMMEKANFARSYATGYDQYRAIMGELGIHVQIEKKKITYFYPGHEKGKRGDKLGRKYDKPFLEESFKTNDEALRANPKLHTSLGQDIASLKTKQASRKGPRGGESEFTEKDYSAFTKVPRGQRNIPYPSDELSHGLLPVGEIRRAREHNIHDYCKRSNIALIINSKGETVVKGREYVSILGGDWINHKNKTRGGVIEFVAAHHRITLLGAVAKLNDNPRLLLLEQSLGKVERGYVSFYIPNQDSLKPPEAGAKLSKFLRTRGCKPELASSLLQNKLVQVGKTGMIRFFPKGESSGAVEFYEEGNGSWQKRKLGASNSPFYSQQGTGKRAFVFTDPFALLKQKKVQLFSDFPRKDGIVGLMEPHTEAIDIFVATNRNIKQLFLVSSASSEHKRAELDFFNNLKSRYSKFGIEIATISHDKALSRGGPELSR